MDMKSIKGERERSLESQQNFDFFNYVDTPKVANAIFSINEGIKNVLIVVGQNISKENNCLQKKLDKSQTDRFYAVLSKLVKYY